MALSSNPVGPGPQGGTTESNVVVGSTAITMQQLQQIYAELTGKSESTSRYYDDPIHLTFDDIEQLYHRIEQTKVQYHVISSSCSFTIYYMKDTKDVFSSFERLSLHISGGAEPVESILIKYDFLVKPPHISKPQNYSISIRIISRLVVESRMRSENIFNMPRLLKILAQHTASVDIAYVDYAIARTFLTAIDEWFQTIPRSQKSRVIERIQTYSHWIPRLTRLTTAAVLTLLLVEMLPHFVGGENSVLQLGRFVLIAGFATYAAYMAAGWLGIFAERAVDRWSNPSYINVNRGDAIEIKKSSNGNRNNLIKGGIGVGGAILVDIVAKVIAELVIRYLA